jgi:hypothetical protein
MKKNSMPAGYTFADNYPVGLIDVIDLYIVIVVYGISARGDQYGGQREEKKTDIRKRVFPNQEQGREILCQPDNDQIAKTG